MRIDWTPYILWRACPIMVFGEPTILTSQQKAEYAKQLEIESRLISKVSMDSFGSCKRASL